MTWNPMQLESFEAGTFTLAHCPTGARKANAQRLEVGKQNQRSQKRSAVKNREPTDGAGPHYLSLAGENWRAKLQETSPREQKPKQKYS